MIITALKQYAELLSRYATTGSDIRQLYHIGELGQIIPNLDGLNDEDYQAELTYINDFADDIAELI